MSALDHKRILFGVTGGISIYKSASLLRRLTRDHHCDTTVVMTRSAQYFMTPLVFETFSGKEVITDMFDSKAGIVGTRHIDLVKNSDLLCVIPATANIIGKAAAGIADDELSTMLMVARPDQVIIAPAMNQNMYLNPHVQKNLRDLKKLGYTLIEPGNGPLATNIEGEGVGRLPNQRELLFQLEKALVGQNGFPLQDKKILITGGPTREYIDDIRFISNPSSGKMGVALAETAAKLGALVTYVTGPAFLNSPCGAESIQVKTAAEMKDVVLKHYPDMDAVIMSAAVEDMTPGNNSSGKIRKTDIPDSLPLKRSDDILFELGKLKKNQLLVGFSVEIENEVENSLRKLKSKNCNMIIVNNPSQDGAGFGTDTNMITIIDDHGGIESMKKTSKTAAAEKIFKRIVETL